MIVSASYRTDIPAFYAAWFVRRLAAGEAWVTNPYGGKPYRVSLAPDDVDGFVFWTRNIAPFRDALAAVEAMRRPYVVQYTVTGYPSALEAGVPPAGHAVAQIRELAARRGRAGTVWRYDPILFTSLTPPDWHRAAFARIADALAAAVDEVTVSFATIYRKSARNLRLAAARHGFDWPEPTADEQRAFLADLALIAADRGLRLTVCSQPHLEQPGVAGAACVDADRLSRIAGHAIRARTKGNRPGCLCAESRDIGAYDTCAHGCAYCYAVRDHERARQTVRRHDPLAERLG
ncbi:MAG: DUF1848 domain-containing protein [Alphaproteobacteria bacterium]|nr:DUF1848 domain-containing protein [Alphaproteobacteria bacterium]MCB9929229.1 DUF1848 domain-containing protein [Alphaproteobacteria bacterium]